MERLHMAGCKVCFDREFYTKIFNFVSGIMLSLCFTFIILRVISKTVMSFPEWGNFNKFLLASFIFVASFLTVSFTLYYKESWGRTLYVFMEKSKSETFLKTLRTVRHICPGTGKAIHVHTRSPAKDYSLGWISKQKIGELSPYGKYRIYFRFRQGGYLFHFLYRLIHWFTPYNRIYYNTDESDIWGVSSWKILPKSHSKAIYLKDKKGAKIGPISICQAMDIMTKAEDINEYLKLSIEKCDDFYQACVNIEALRRCATYRARGAVAEKVNAIVNGLKAGNFSTGPFSYYIKEEDIAKSENIFFEWIKTERSRKTEAEKS